MKNNKKEFETLSARKKRKATANRGKPSEDVVQTVLVNKKKGDINFDFDRLLDSRAAGRIVPAQVSDYLLFFGGKSAALEVKELKKGFRLSKAAFPQRSRMLRRAKAGCLGFALVHTLENDKWMLARIIEFNILQPSWRLTTENCKQFKTAKDAVERIQECMINTL